MTRRQALIYRRVSTEEQALSGSSLDDQLQECRRKAEALGAAEIIDMIDDVGGDYLERPRLQQALEFCRTGAVGWFICWDPDRFSRSLLNQMLAADLIEASGVELVFVNHAYSRTPEGILFFQIRGAFAQYEKAKILERTRRGKRAKAGRGKLPGWIDPYGYRMDAESDTLELEPTQARWVQLIFTWASDPDPGRRLGPARIAERLDALSVPPPRGGACWYRSTVRDILRNPLYTGVLIWGRFSHRGVLQSRRARAAKRLRPEPRPKAEWVHVPVPAIVDRALWERVQQYLDLDRNRRSPGAKYLLTGLVRCGRCGGAVGLKRTPQRYFCCGRRYPRPGGCDLPHIRAEPVEEFVWRTVQGWVRESAKPPPAPDHVATTELAGIRAELEANAQAQERLLSFIARHGAAPELADRQMRRLVVQAAALQARQMELEQCPTPPPPPTPSPPHSPPEAPSEAERRNLVRRHVARVILSGKEQTDWQVLPLHL